MKKILVNTLILLLTSTAYAYVSTYLPREVHSPQRVDEEGYDEHTLGQWYFLQGYERKGISYLEHAAQQGYTPAYRRLGDIYMHKKGFTTRAKEYYLIAANKGDVLAIEELAEILVNEGNYKDAVKYYEKLVLKNPAYWLQLHGLYVNLGNRKKAANAFKNYQEFKHFYFWHR